MGGDGIAETVDELVDNQEAREEKRPIWHLPLMLVDEPHKIRICHDAAASVGGINLNSLLLGGPNLTNNLAAILLLFRATKFIFTTDISGFFHRVLVDEDDLDAFRYPFFTNEKMEDIAIKRFLSYIFGSGASSLITGFVTRHLADALKDDFPENVSTTIRKQFYVDDGGGGDDQLAVELKSNLKKAMLRGGFHLSKWKANHPALLEPEDGASQPSVVEDKILKILGISWNPLEDVFRSVMDMKKLRLPARTPCQLVFVQSSLFDPCGFVSPFILIGRQIMQRATHKKRGWDSPLDPQILEEFFLWASSIPLLANYPIPHWWNIDDTIGALFATQGYLKDGREGLV